jgi:hypothetical protein
VAVTLDGNPVTCAHHRRWAGAGNAAGRCRRTAHAPGQRGNRPTARRSFI